MFYLIGHWDDDDDGEFAGISESVKVKNRATRELFSGSANNCPVQSIPLSLTRLAFYSRGQRLRK